MMNTLFIVFKNFKKQIIRYIIAMIFVALSVYMMNISLSRYIHEQYLNNLVGSSGLDGFYYISPISKRQVRDLQIIDYVSGRTEEMKTSGKVENYYRISGGNVPVNSSGGSNRLDFVFCGSDLLKDIRYPLSKGTWFDKYENNDGTPTPVVISYDLALKYKVGEEFDALGERYVIIGVLERNAQVLGSGAGGSGLNLSSVFDNAANTVIVCGDSPYEIVDNIIVRAPSLNQQDFNFLKNIANVISFDELSKRYTKENKSLLTMQTTILMLMLLISVISISSNNLLAVIINRKKYSVYYMCGMEWKTAVTISFIEAVIKLVLPAVVGYIVFLLYCEQNQYSSLRVNEINILFTVLLLVIIFLLTSLKPLFDIKRTSPVKIISEI